MRFRKESEQQTDLTYGHVNKKVQADTMADEDQNSDIDIMLGRCSNFVDLVGLKAFSTRA